MTTAHRARRFKTAIYEQFARITSALANPRRLELIDLLAQGERAVEELAKETSTSIANVSQHLQRLKQAQLVEVRRDGLYAYYRIADDNVFQAWQAIRDLGEARLGDLMRVVETYFEDRERLEAVTLEELRDRLHEESVVILDVRPDLEYCAGHIPGAISAPIDELAANLAGLPKDGEVIAYCRGPYCVFADEAVAVLRENGYRARRLAAGFPDWRAKGLPIEC